MQLAFLRQPLRTQQRIFIRQLLQRTDHLVVIGVRSPEDPHGQQRHSQLRLLRNSIRTAQHITDPHTGQAVDYCNVSCCK
ncbi:hypothetical protein D3C73_1561610 [compost metagenome]